MRLDIDTSNKHFTVAKSPEARIDNVGTQRTDKGNQHPLWVTQLLVRDDDGGDVINVTTASPKEPDVEEGEEVDVTGLVAIPWESRGKHGLSFRASAIVAFEDDE